MGLATATTDRGTALNAAAISHTRNKNADQHNRPSSSNVHKLQAEAIVRGLSAFRQISWTYTEHNGKTSLLLVSMSSVTATWPAPVTQEEFLCSLPDVSANNSTLLSADLKSKTRG